MSAGAPPSDPHCWLGSPTSQRRGQIGFRGDENRLHLVTRDVAEEMELYYYIEEEIGYFLFYYPTNVASVNLVTGCSKVFFTIVTPALAY